MRIAIGMTIGEIVKPETSSTIALMAWHIGRKGHNLSYLSEQSAYLDENANHVFERAQKFEADYLMMIETDIDYMGEDDVIGRMIAYNQDAVSGIYYGGKYPHRPLIHNFTDTPGELFLPGITPENEAYFMDAVGSGFILLSKNILDAFTPEVVSELGKPYDFLWKDGKIIWRQDLAFCWRLKQLGFKILIDPSIKLGHVKQQVVTKTHWDLSRDHMEKTGNVI